MYHIRTIEGQLNASDLKIAMVASRFNNFMVDKLTGGAFDYLLRHGAKKEDLVLVKVPGAFELPIVAQKLAKSGRYAGVICLGVVIRGATPHFDYVCNESVKGMAHVCLETGVPIGFGLLTTDNLEQAIERSGSKGGNKGVEAAAAVLETIRVLEQIEA